VVLFHQVLGVVSTPELLGQGSKLVLEDVGEAFEEDQGKDVVLELGGVHRPADGAGRLPQPIFQSRKIEPPPLQSHLAGVYAIAN